MDDLVVDKVARLGGTTRVTELIRGGHSRKQIESAVSSGRLVRLRRGLVGIPQGDRDIRTAVSINGRITCVSACKELGLWSVKDPSRLHVWSDHGRMPASIATHRGPLVGHELPGPYVPVLDAVLHALRCRPALEALVIAESAVRLNAVSRDDLVQNLCGPRNAAYRRLVDRVGLDAESPLEVIARELFRSAGLAVDTQVPIAGVGRVDLLIEGRLIVELDGFDFHWNRETFRKDRKRNNAAALSGFHTMRYVYEDLMFTPDEVVMQVMTMVRRAS